MIPADHKKLLLDALQDIEEKHKLSAKFVSAAIYAIEHDDLESGEEYIRKLRPMWERTYRALYAKIVNIFPELFHMFRSNVDSMRTFTSNN